MSLDFGILSYIYPTHHWKQGNIIMTNWCVQEITFYRIQRALHNGIFFNILAESIETRM